MAVKGSVPDPGTIVPHLVVRNMQEAVEFYNEAFSAMVLYRSPSPSGEGEHAHLRVWSSLIQVSTEEPGYKRRQMAGAFLAAPESLGGSTCVFQVGVPDVDAAYQRAIDNGALPALICFGATGTAGSAIRSVTCGHYVRFAKSSRRMKLRRECRHLAVQ